MPENTAMCIFLPSDRLKQIIESRDIQLSRKNILNQKAVRMDRDVVRMLKQAAENTEARYRELSSMAGHDASHIAGICQTAMLFVKSIDGKSHCPEEFSALKILNMRQTSCWKRFVCSINRYDCFSLYEMTLR